MHLSFTLLIAGLALAPSLTFAQDTGGARQPAEEAHPDSSTHNKKVVITGARFCYEIIEAWIQEYKTANPDVEILIASRSLTDPLKHDILVEVYEQDEAVRRARAYLNIGRYAILPVTTTGSPVAAAYGEQGLDANLIKRLFFGDIFAADKTLRLNAIPFTVYTRLQNAGVPKQFSIYYGYEQKDLQGIAIAGADAHLREAMLRDSTGVTYLPLALIYNLKTRKPITGLTILPVDLNGNKKVSDDEKFYDELDVVIDRLEREDARDIKTIPLPYFHLSVDKENASKEAIDFLSWVNEHGRRHLHQFGFLLPEDDKGNGEFREYALRRQSESVNRQ